MMSAVSLLLAAGKSVLAAAILFVWAASLGWRGILDQKFVSKLSFLTKNMFLPCLIFTSVAGGISLSFVRENWSLVLIGLLVLVNGFAGGHGLAKLVSLPDALKPWFVLSVAVPNMVALPLVLVEAICREQETSTANIARCVDGYTTRLFTVTLTHTFIFWTVAPPYVRSFASADASAGATADRRAGSRGPAAERAGLKDAAAEEVAASSAATQGARTELEAGALSPRLTEPEPEVGGAEPLPELVGSRSPQELLPTEGEGDGDHSPSKTKPRPVSGRGGKCGACRRCLDWLLDNPPVASNLLALPVAAWPPLHRLFYAHGAPLSFLASVFSLLGKASPAMTNTIAGCCFGISRTTMAVLVVGRIVLVPLLNLLMLLLLMPIVPRDPWSRLALVFQPAGTTANVVTLMAQVMEQPEGAQLVALAAIPQMLLYIPVSTALIALGMAWNEGLGA